MKQTLYLIRHGNTPGTEKGILYGSTDLPLTEAGFEQIRLMASEGIYPDHKGAGIYTSGMLRAEQTLAAIYGEVHHAKAPLLREFDLGIFEMMTVDEVLEDEYGRAWLHGEVEDLRFEGGDSEEGFIARVDKGFHEIIEREAAEGREKIIIVAHGGVIAYSMAACFPDRYENKWDWTPDPGSGFVLHIEDGRVISWEPLGEPETGHIPTNN